MHAEPVAGDLLDARMGGPGALFELELAPFDFERAHALAPEHETARRLLEQARAEPR